MRKLFAVVLFTSVIALSLPAFAATNFWNAENTNLSIAGKLFVDVTNSRIGINITSPTQALHVQGNSNVTGNATAAFFLGDGSLLTGVATGESPWDNTSTQIFVRAGYPTFINASNALFVNGTSGNVSIGTTSPSQRLHVNGSLRIDNSTGSAIFLANATSGQLSVQNGTSSAPSYSFFDDLNVGIFRDPTGVDRLGIVADNQVNFFTPGSSQGYASIRGNIGIGDFTSGILFGPSIGGVDGVGIGRTGSNVLGLMANGFERIRITATGLVGINTTSPTNLLTINGSTSSTILNITDGTRQFGVYIGALSGGGTGVSLGTPTEHQFRLFTNNTDRLTIDTLGNASLAGNFTPGANNTYSLGSPTLLWKSIYVGPGSVFLGDKALTNDAGTLKWGGITVGSGGHTIANLTNGSLSSLTSRTNLAFDTRYFTLTDNSTLDATTVAGYGTLTQDVWGVVETQTLSAANGSFTLEAGKSYRLMFNLITSAASPGTTIRIRFNNDSNANYQYTLSGRDSAGASRTTGATSHTLIELNTDAANPTPDIVSGFIEWTPKNSDSGFIGITGNSYYRTEAGGLAVDQNIGGRYNGSSGATSIQVFPGTGTISGKLVLLKLGPVTAGAAISVPAFTELTITGSQSVTSTSFVPVANGTTNLTMNGGRLMAGFSCNAHNTNSGYGTFITLFINGVNAGNSAGLNGRGQSTASEDEFLGFNFLSNQSYTGFTNLSLQISVGAGTSVLNPRLAACKFWAYEVRNVAGTGDVASNGNNVYTGTNNFTNGLTAGAAPSTPTNNTLYRDNMVKAWVNFNGASASCPSNNCVIRSSFNVLNVTWIGTGTYKVYWKTPFPDANYMIQYTVQRDSGDSGTFGFIEQDQGGVNESYVALRTLTHAGVDVESGVNMVMAIGNQ